MYSVSIMMILFKMSNYCVENFKAIFQTLKVNFFE